MDITSDDRDLMTRVVLGEASNNPTEQAGVAWNILNRVGKPGFADSIRGVVQQPNQYSSVSNPSSGFNKYSTLAYTNAGNIVDSVISGKTPDPTGGAPNFLAASMPENKRPKWASGSGQQIGKTIFYGGNQGTPLDESDYRHLLTSQPSPSVGRPEGAPGSVPLDSKDFGHLLDNEENQPTADDEELKREAQSTTRVAGAFQQFEPYSPYKAIGGASAMEPGLRNVGPSGETLTKLVGALAGGAGAFGAAKNLPSLITKGIPAASKIALGSTIIGLLARGGNEILGPENSAKALKFLQDIVHYSEH